MGSGASATAAVFSDIGDSVKGNIVRHADQLYERSKTLNDEAFLKVLQDFDLSASKKPPKKSYVTPDGEPQLLSVSIIHRHGSRGPGESELKPWTNRQHPIVSQWNPAELEAITLNGHILLNSLGRWFAERYLMTSLDNSNSRPKDAAFCAYPETKISFEKLQNKTAVWRASRSGRAKQSGEDFVQAINKTYNHPLQTRPAKLLPASPSQLTDVEGEARADDHGADHYFRPWNVHKKQIEEVKKQISANIIWIEKANKHKNYLVRLFKALGTDASFLKDAPKMLWCTTYILSLCESERYWMSDAASLDRLGKRDAVLQAVGGTESADYKCLNDLACWAWNRRFAYHPYLLELGSRITFEMLQQLMYFADGSLNVYSAHDYTILGILGLLQVTQAEGGITQPMQFSAYLTMELWSKPPAVHHSSESRAVKQIFDPERSDGAHNQHVHLPGGTNSSDSMSDTTKALTSRSLTHESTDQRVVRILLNDAPFDSADQHVVHKLQKKFSRARDVKDQEAFMSGWPVHEEKERLVLQLTISELTVLMGNMYEGMRAANLGPHFHKKEQNFEEWAFKYL